VTRHHGVLHWGKHPAAHVCRARGGQERELGDRRRRPRLAGRARPAGGSSAELTCPAGAG
jgi:hypothetical protein